MIKTQFYPAKAQRQSDIPLVLLHGWASDSASWQPLLFELNHHRDIITVDLPSFGGSDAIDSNNLNDWLEALWQVLPETSVLVGWSLGGMLATALAAQKPNRVAALITLASNAKFVRGDGWRAAMPVKIERQFYSSFIEHSAAALKMFSMLEAQGELDERASVKQLRALQRDLSVNEKSWAQALELLAAIDNRQALAMLKTPALLLYADGDALVPAACAEVVSALNPNLCVSVLAESGHAVHITQPEKVLAPIQAFLAGLT